MARSRVSLAETAALLWPDGRRIPRREPERRLVHDLAAPAVVSAAYDPGLAEDEPADGMSGELVVRLGTPGRRPV